MKFCLVASLLVGLAAGLAAGPVIVADGKARAVIVIAAAPSESAKRAADELQHFVQLISGAELPILDDAAELPAGQAKLLVGRSRLLRGVNIPSGHDKDATREGYLLKTKGQNVIIAGNEEAEYRGTEYAVYELLERLGCRWYFPGEFGQVTPKAATIRLPDLDVAERPSFTVRNIWMSGWADRTGDHKLWLVRNKGTWRKMFAFPGDGSIHKLAPRAKYGEKFPEMYAMGKDGKRQDAKTPAHRTMLCTTNANAVAVAAGSIIEHFRAHPEANSYGFSAPDGSPRCYCPTCVAGDHDLMTDSGITESISDAYYNFVNNVMHKVNEEFPKKYIVVLAYANRVRPPEGLDQPWSKNIIVQLARLRLCSVPPIGQEGHFFARRHERTLKAWSRIAPKLLIYDYDPHADLSRMPYWRSRAIASDMPLYMKYGVIGFTTEAHNSFFRTGLNYYVRTKFMWNVESDVDALLDDFYTRFFGRAAGPMKQFIEQVEAMLVSSPDHMTWTPLSMDWSAIYPPAQVAALGPLLAQAEELADTPELKARISLYRTLHGYMTTYLRVYSLYHAGQFEAARAEVEKLPAFIAAAQEVQPGLLPAFPGWVVKRGSGPAYLQAHVGGVADRAGGKLGELLALAPETAQFRPDPRNEGLFEQWYHNDVAAKLDWDRVALTRGWHLSGYEAEDGYAYDGCAWYRFAAKCGRPKDGNAQLLLPLVYAEKLWVWVNDQLVYSPANVRPEGETPLPGRAVILSRRGGLSILIDVSKPLRPGAVNSFTFRLIGTETRLEHRGIVERPVIWSPKAGTLKKAD